MLGAGKEGWWVTPDVSELEFPFCLDLRRSISCSSRVSEREEALEESCGLGT